MLRSALVTLLGCCALLASACDGADQTEALEARIAELQTELEDRFTPGLHTLMVDLSTRHAALWFAGEARNWPLADYMVHELEELIEEIEELHPMYREVRVAELLREMTTPAIELLEAAVEEESRDDFRFAYDQLTTACNACHIATDRAAIVMQRPTVPPLTNLRFDP